LLYFDHNATTPVAPEVADAMALALREVYGNASSLHRQGQLARQHLDNSRRIITRFLNAGPNEFVFTSGGTEANNLAMLGLVRSLPGDQKHVITTAIEHPSVLEPCRQLEREGVLVTYLRPDVSGIIDPEEVRRNLRPATVLVSVMHVNNEVGTIQPIREIAALVRESRQPGHPIYLHSDGIQALGKIETDIQSLGVDLYSISAHKIFAPKGIGGLFVRKGTPLGRLQQGGRHEHGRRAGTENVPGIMAFAHAVELCSQSAPGDLALLRDQFEAEVLSALDNVEVNGAVHNRLPNTSNLLFRGISGEALLIALDMRGIAVSTGAACSSGSIEPSHVLLAMGRSQPDARSSVRFSFGRYNTGEEVRTLAGAVIASASHVRKTTKWGKHAV
jgi:cysteine desulfurase